MTGSDRPSPLSPARESARQRGFCVRGRRLAVVVGLWIAAVLFAATAPSSASEDERAPVLRLAVVPFEGERAEDESAIARQLAIRIERLGVDRLIAPGSFVAESTFDPRAEVVRGWADLVAVDTLVVGRVLRPDPRAELRVVEAVARSGHSGAELFRHAVRVPLRAGLGSSLDLLAAAIVRGLGGNPALATEAEQSPLRPAVSANADGADPTATVTAPKGAAPANDSTRAGAAATKAEGGVEKSKSGSARDSVAARFRVESFDSDAPIEIHADAAEIQAEGATRKIVFQGSVSVRQDNVSIRSERLEADYADGGTEPSRLLARGAVHVVQAERSARCDRAEYLRADQSLSCRGHAELIQGCDVVRGERIVLDFAGGRARVEGAASILIHPKRSASGGCLPAPETPEARP